MVISSFVLSYLLSIYTKYAFYVQGEWRHGQRHGKGEATFIPQRDSGDERRLFIKGNNAMYRMARYCGDFLNDVRHGDGVMYFSNGEGIEGTFKNGHVDGIAQYIYTSGRRRFGRWERGTRLKWLTEEEETQRRTIETIARCIEKEVLLNEVDTESKKAEQI
jgi:hypothetical protein